MPYSISRRQVYKYITSAKKFCNCFFLLWIEVLNPKSQAYTTETAVTLVALARDFLLPPSVNAQSLAITLFKLFVPGESINTATNQKQYQVFG